MTYQNIATRRTLRNEQRQADPKSGCDPPAFAGVTLSAIDAVCCGVIAAGQGVR